MKREKVTLVIVAILAVAGVAAGLWIILSELNSANMFKEIDDDGNRMAPGTKLIYSVSTEQNGIMFEGTSTYEVLGQNPSGYLYKLSYDLAYPDGTKYEVNTKIRLTNDGNTTAINAGMDNVSTISGKFRMPYVEYVSSGTIYRDYYDPYTNIMYLSTSQNSSSRVELISIDAVWQTAKDYSPSEHMGYETIYDVSGISNGMEISGTYSEIIVAENDDGKIGIRSLSTVGNHSSISYLFDAMATEGIRNTGSVTENTIDGSKTLSIYSYSIDSIDYKRYISVESGACYKLEIESDTDSLLIELTSYGINNSLWS